MKLRSLVFNIGFWGWILLLGGSFLPFCCIYPPLSFTVSRLWGKGSLWMLRVLCGITYEVRGSEHIPAGAALIACKHQSAWDTIIFWVIFKRPAYVLKRELLWFPVFGWYLILLKNIYINRKSGASALKQMLRKATLRAGENRPIVIFPEGTRISPGETSIYHPGIAALYQHLKIPTIPVALNSGLLWKKNAFTKQPGIITIEFLPPIAPGLKGREFLKTLQERIETKSAQLLQLSP